jgi:putative sigma-54 modulation protein
MKIDIITRDYKMTDRLEEILVTKINRLDKYFPDNQTPAKVVLKGNDKRNCKMEISILYHGMQIRSEVTGDNMYYLIDDIMPKVERQIVKHRGKLNERYKLPQIKKDDYMFTSEVVEEKNFEIAKTKKFPIQKIELKEAVQNLEMLDHDFYLFVNDATDNVEVVYRRKDGTIGHLQPYEE